MRSIALSIAVSTGIGIGMLSVPISASAQPWVAKDHIVVEGKTSWDEVGPAITELRRTWGINITARKCSHTPTELCVWWRHTTNPSDKAYARGAPWFGVEVNDAIPPNGSAHRTAIIYHELGHIMGLAHNEGAVSSCGSSMATSAVCYRNGVQLAPIGYSPAERRAALKTFGKKSGKSVVSTVTPE